MIQRALCDVSSRWRRFAKLCRCSLLLISFSNTRTREALDQVPRWGEVRRNQRASKRRVRVPFLGNAFAGGSTFSSFHALQNIFSAVSPSRDPNALHPLHHLLCAPPSHHHHFSGTTLVMPGTPSLWEKDKERAAPLQLDTTAASQPSQKEAVSLFPASTLPLG